LSGVCRLYTTRPEMTPLLAVLPAFLVLIAVLILRWSGLMAALAAAVCALVIALMQPFQPFGLGLIERAVADASILTLTAAAMIVPGVLFVEATRRQGATSALAAVVSALDMPPARRAIFVAVGLGVLIESMTGMGVSLLVTVPLLLGIADRRAAIGLALVGMSLMPWGALGISGIVGAKLAGLPPDMFAAAVSQVSGAVAMLLPLLCLAFLRDRGLGDVAAALAVGGVLAAAIVATSAVAGLELAGVAGGLAVAAVLALTAQRRDFGTALRQRALLPYATLIGAVVVQKALIAPAAAMGLAPAISSGRISFTVLSSPGLALTVATVVASFTVLDRAVLTATANRAWRPVASIALFMISARLLVECGAVPALASALSQLGPSAAAVATVVLGAVSGFVTGSGVSGNALFMPAAAETGRSLGALPLFAALQNGAAGHTAMASLPVAAILLAALPERTTADDRTALRIGLSLAALYAAVLAVIAIVLLNARLA
jgi:lactate permease